MPPERLPARLAPCGNETDRHDIVICDRSALFFHLHGGARDRSPAARRSFSLGVGYAGSARELQGFNTEHPLFGGEPVSVLVPRAGLRMKNTAIEGHLISSPLPPYSVAELREGLYVATPEFVFVRMASLVCDTQLAEIGTNLCARYYLDVRNGSIENRTTLITSPAKLRSFAVRANGVRGCAKASRVLRWVAGNSGSPMETKVKLLFSCPLWKGGFALPFDAMNYDVSAGRLAGLAEQGAFCLDLVSTERRVGLEYDGAAYHLDVGKDHRRRNALRALGWEVFPLDKGVLYDADATERLGMQIAKRMGVRLQRQGSWESRYAKLRAELGLPT